MEERKIADYFILAGLPEDPGPLDPTALEHSNKEPITDISVIFPSLDENLPPDFTAITTTPTGLNADLNHGSIRTIALYLCYRRGRDKPPLVDIGIMYEGKERLMQDAEIVEESVGGHVANVNNSTTAKTFLTYRRGKPDMPCNALVVTDICVVITSRGETPPHAFCCISKNLNRGIVGSDVYVCYKKSMNRAKLLTYKPEVLSRYPAYDLPHFPFPHSVPLFCLPMGATMELWPSGAIRPEPVFSTFILTVSDAKHKVYGSALSFYEKVSSDTLSEEQRESLGYEDDSDFVINVNKSICILSHWPFSDAFENWLKFLHSIVTSNEPQIIPIERYIIQLLDEVAFPAPRTLLQLSAVDTNIRVILTQPEDLPLPRSAAGFKKLLINLGPENCLQVLVLALTEQKILIHSLRPDTLTAVAEAVSSLLFPFNWQCPYIPLCPLDLVDLLHAPLPFLIGVDSRFFNHYEPPMDVSCIDLDTNIITVPETSRQLLSVKLLPKRASKCLKTLLEGIYFKIRKDEENKVQVQDSLIKDNIEQEFLMRKKEQALEFEIQEAFLKFMVLILKGYRSFLLPITKAPTVGTTDPQALFQMNDFLKSRDKSHHKFFTLLMRTQMFIRFIEERSFVVDGDQGLSFFDECIERISEEGEIGLIEHDTVHRSDRTVFVLPPEPLQSNPITYTEFVLDPTLVKIKKHKRLSLFHTQLAMPGSPMTRRTKHEIRSAQKFAKKCYRSPDLWAKCLCGTCHTLYFMVLPSILSTNDGKEKAILEYAYELLVRATELRLACDEVCYRLMMQLCGEHSRPLLAVNLLVLMKKFGIQPNALTYGLYNRCVLEAEWTAYSSSSQVLWNKLRNVVMGAAQFKWAAKRKAARKMSASSGYFTATSLLDDNDRAASRTSLDSHETIHVDSLLQKFKRSIFKGSLHSSQQSVADAVDSTENISEVNESEESEGAAEEPKAVENSFTPPSSPKTPVESRVLTRSESAGDANIIDKLQLNNKKNCSRALHFNCDHSSEENEVEKVSPVISRTTITENDPLGAFVEPPAPTIAPPPIEVTSTTPTMTDDPVLFRSSVHKSATFDGSPPSQNKIHRSETVPAATVASSLANLSTTFKLGFSRYSPSRLSLRKADLKVPQQFIENAITSLSPSSLTGKKSNELIQGGLSSIKMAASTMAKKFDELKEAISTSANSTPIKVLSVDRLGSSDLIDQDYDLGDGSEAGERLRKVSGELGNYSGSCTNLKESDQEVIPENLFSVHRVENIDSAYNISMTSCSQCHNCQYLLYDEEIMAHWSAEDSNLNTICHGCYKPTVPLLTITITGPETTYCDQFSVPYLNPLVLRKELENIMSQEGDLSLADPKFVNEHPIIYWNLIWFFERINVQTHLVNLYLKSKVVLKTSAKSSTEELDNDDSNRYMKPVEAGTDPLTQELAAQTASASVTCFWDQPLLHGDRLPMYILWSNRAASPGRIGQNGIKTKIFMQNIISNIRLNDLEEPIKSLASQREKLSRVAENEEDAKNGLSFSIYRDILFLACKVLGRPQVDLNIFDKEYMFAYSKVTERQNKYFDSQDKLICVNSLYCRQYFRPLSLS